MAGEEPEVLLLTLNIGLLWMSFISAAAAGYCSAVQVRGEGYYEARSFAFIHDGASAVMGWMRMPGDVIFLVGIIPLIKAGTAGYQGRFSPRT